MNIKVDFVGTTLQLSKPLDGKFTWDEFMNLDLRDDWRQPKRWELIQLFDEAKEAGFLFSNTTAVWSASAAASSSDDAGTVNFDYGYSNYYDRNYPFGVRLVKEIENEYRKERW